MEKCNCCRKEKMVEGLNVCVSCAEILLDRTNSCIDKVYIQFTKDVMHLIRKQETPAIKSKYIED